MANYQIIDSKDRWDEVVRSFAQYDFFHFYQYHEVQAQSLDAKPWMIVRFSAGRPVFAFPLLLRQMDNEFFDLVSVYGYSGPLIQIDDELDNEMHHLQEYLEILGCVSLFCRMHPVIHQSVGSSPFVFDCGKTISVELKPSVDRINTYRKTTRYDIRKLEKLGAHVKFDCDDDSFNAFLEIYYQTMKDLDADSSYFFDNKFLNSIFKLPDTTAVIGRVIFEGQTISAAIFTVCNGIAQYFLGGALAEHAKIAPQKLLLHNAGEWAISNNATVLHLGGGRGSQEDGLFKFKSGFSKNTLPFRVVKMITNQSEYKRRCEYHRNGNSENFKSASVSSYFPEYRSP